MDELNNTKTITESIDKISTTTVIITGEFNLKYINWQTAPTSKP